MRHKSSCVPDCSTFFTSSGDLFQPVYSPKLEKDGSISLTQVDRIDLKREINSHISECDMSAILASLAAGDSSVLCRRSPMFGDFTGVPSSYAELLDSVAKSRSFFEQLPVSVKEKYNNSLSEWLSVAGSSDWMSDLGFKAADESNESEVSSDES